MENPTYIKGAIEFAASFAESLAAALTDATETPWPFEILDAGNTPVIEETPFQYRLAVEGALQGECFVEFYGAQVEAVLGKMIKQPPKGLVGEERTIFAEFLSSVAQSLGSSSLAKYGALSFKIEKVAELAFGGMYVVPIAARGSEPELQVLLYFNSQLLDALTAACGDEIANGVKDNPIRPYNLKLVMDVELNVSMRFGQRQMPIREVLELSSGSIIELDRMVNEPVELLLDGKVIALGEAVVVDGNYGLRVTEIPLPIASHFLN